MVVEKHEVGRDIFIIAGITVVTVFIWIGLDIHRSFKKSAVPKVLTEQLRTLNPDFDMETLDQLEKRLSINEKELESLPPRKLNILEGKSSVSKVGQKASPSASLAPLTTASPSGGL